MRVAKVNKENAPWRPSPGEGTSGEVLSGEGAIFHRDGTDVEPSDRLAKQTASESKLQVVAGGNRLDARIQRAIIDRNLKNAKSTSAVGGNLPKFKLSSFHLRGDRGPSEVCLPMMAPVQQAILQTILTGRFSRVGSVYYDFSGEWVRVRVVV